MRTSNLHEGDLVEWWHPEMKNLGNKELICSCGNHIDRDHNAAINILKNAK